MSQPFLGGCKSCDYTLFATAEDVQEAKGFDEVRPGLAYRVEGRDGRGPAVFSRCNLKHKVFLLKQIKGTYSPDHKCDSRCLNAKGNECTCSCGGANHGRGHAVTVHQAGEPEPEKRFLGEEGKYIKGRVKLVSIRTIEGGYSPTDLMTFVTPDETAILKWFAPFGHEDEFEVGKEITIRAKVKRHENHERFGKATIVTHVKEVE